MEFRKLISFGKSSYVVSLPKAWVTKQKLKKGDIIYFEERDHRLILSAQEEKKNKEQKKIVIKVDGIEIKQIKRTIIGAYIQNHKTISLEGKEIKKKAREIQTTLQSLIAMEVIEQTSEKIVAKDFLNYDDVSVNNIIRKIDLILRAMLEDVILVFEEDVCENINYRDNDVNKLVFLIFRIVRFGFENHSYFSKKFNLSFIDLFTIHYLASYLEQLGDDIKRIARRMKASKFSQKEKQRYKELLKKIKDCYLKTMKAYYNKDLKTIHEVINLRDQLIKECENFYSKNKKIPGIGFLIDRTKATIVHICQLGRVLYQN